MVFKGLFRTGSEGKGKGRKAADSKPTEAELTIEDLIVLERYE